MKFIIPLLASIMMVGCMPATSPTALRTSSVALIEYDEGEVHAYCSGTFVAKDEILTASHCVSGIENETDTDDDSVVFTFIIPTDEGSDISTTPSGQHLAKLQKIDRDKDLALLKVLSPDGFPHSFVKVAKNRPNIGDRVYSVSTPHGLFFSYNEGWVAAYRKDVSGESNFNARYIQITLPGAYFGSSGSGCENSNGELIGVVSLAPTVPTAMLVIDTEEIRVFLQEK